MENIVYSTLATTASSSWSESIPHSTAYTWHWRLDIIVMAETWGHVSDHKQQGKC